VWDRRCSRCKSRASYKHHPGNAEHEEPYGRVVNSRCMSQMRPVLTGASPTHGRRAFETAELDGQCAQV